jgi:hypothetical protein
MAAAAETEMIEPEHDSSVTLAVDGEVAVVWQSVQDHAAEDTLRESIIRLEGDAGTTVSRTVDRGEAIGNGEEAEHRAAFPRKELEDLEDGFWEVSVSDRWEEENEGVRMQSSDTILFQLEREEEELDEDSLAGEEDRQFNSTGDTSATTSSTQQSDSAGTPDTASSQPLLSTLTGFFPLLNTILILLLAGLMWRR